MVGPGDSIKFLCSEEVTLWYVLFVGKFILTAVCIMRAKIGGKAALEVSIVVK